MQTAKLSAENETFRKELEALKFKYGALLTTAKTHEEMAARAAREGQLRAEEVRLPTHACLHKPVCGNPCSPRDGCGLCACVCGVCRCGCCVPRRRTSKCRIRS